MTTIDILSDLRGKFNCFDEKEEPYYRALSEAITALTADVVEVVQCKDCVNCEYDSIFNQYWCGGSEVISDGFCNYGERKDD